MNGAYRDGAVAQGARGGCYAGRFAVFWRGNLLTPTRCPYFPTLPGLPARSMAGAGVLNGEALMTPAAATFLSKRQQQLYAAAINGNSALVVSDWLYSRRKLGELGGQLLNCRAVPTTAIFTVQLTIVGRPNGNASLVYLLDSGSERVLHGGNWAQAAARYGRPPRCRKGIGCGLGSRCL